MPPPKKRRLEGAVLPPPSPPPHRFVVTLGASEYAELEALAARRGEKVATTARRSVEAILKKEREQPS